MSDELSGTFSRQGPVKGRAGGRACAAGRWGDVPRPRFGRPEIAGGLAAYRFSGCASCPCLPHCEGQQLYSLAVRSSLEKGRLQNPMSLHSFHGDRATLARRCAQRSTRRCLTLQPLGMPGDVLGHEGRDEKVGVVVTLLHTQGEGDAGSRACLFEKPGLEPAFEKPVSASLIDEEFPEPFAVFYQSHRVVGAPGRLVAAQIGGESLA